ELFGKRFQTGISYQELEAFLGGGNNLWITNPHFRRARIEPTGRRRLTAIPLERQEKRKNNFRPASPESDQQSDAPFQHSYIPQAPAYRHRFISFVIAPDFEPWSLNIQQH